MHMGFESEYVLNPTELTTKETETTSLSGTSVKEYQHINDENNYVGVSDSEYDRVQTLLSDISDIVSDSEITRRPITSEAMFQEIEDQNLPSLSSVIDAAVAYTKYYTNTVLVDNDVPSPSAHREGVQIFAENNSQLFTYADNLANEINKEIDCLYGQQRGKKNDPVYPADVLSAASFCESINKPKVCAVVRQNKNSKPAKQGIIKLFRDIAGVGTTPRHWDTYPLIDSTNNSYSLTPYGKFVALIISPQSRHRETNQYLPGDDNSMLSLKPSLDEIRNACFACALGLPNEDRRDLFREAYNQRMTGRVDSAIAGSKTA